MPGSESVSIPEVVFVSSIPEVVFVSSHGSTLGDVSREEVTRDLIVGLKREGLTVAVAESLTGGLLLAELTRVPTSSAAIWGGIVAYSTEIKHSLLGVSSILLSEHGPVHPEVAVQMAAGVRTVFSVGGVDADVGISTTGVAGPDGQGGQPPGTVFVALSFGDATRCYALKMSGSRDEIRENTVQFALTIVSDAVNSLSEGGGI